jgi:hypothetical protein
MTNQSIDEKSTLGFQVSLTQRCVDECKKLELVLASNSPSMSVQTVAAATQSAALLFSWARQQKSGIQSLIFQSFSIMSHQAFVLVY